MHEYLEIRSDKSISGISPCGLVRTILKNNYFENEELRYDWDQARYSIF